MPSLTGSQTFSRPTAASVRGGSYHRTYVRVFGEHAEAAQERLKSRDQRYPIPATSGPQYGSHGVRYASFHAEMPTIQR
jgi:hypothetical protein